jgi:riboflavin kinase
MINNLSIGRVSLCLLLANMHMRIPFARSFLVVHYCPGVKQQTLRHLFQSPLILSCANDVDIDSDHHENDASSRAKRLNQLLRFRGPVAKGYGRGGKKLGVPTANLPASLFETALGNVNTGVYLGWALLEGSTQGRNVPIKAVVNVGYSPTFEGQENPEKIVEAHLILEPPSTTETALLSLALDPPDFYGETMRLQLSGFLRDEQKFPSFGELIQQINADVADAKNALDVEPFHGLKGDVFLDTSSSMAESAWVGSSGGDEIASWEFVDMNDGLKGL